MEFISNKARNNERSFGVEHREDDDEPMERKIFNKEMMSEADQLFILKLVLMIIFFSFD